MSGLGSVIRESFAELSESDFSAGAGLGSSWQVGDKDLTVKLKGRYRRWFDSEVNEFQVLIGLGGRIGGR